MTRRRLLPAALVALALAAPAPAPAVAAFAPPASLDLPAGRPLSAAIAPDGAATVAGLLSDSPVQARIEIATRQAAGLPWRIAGFPTSAQLVRDIQVVAAPGGTVVAWSEVRRHSNSVVVATVDGNADLTVRERVPVASGSAAFPRLALLHGETVVLAWRDGRTSARARVRVATFEGTRFTRAPRTAGTDVAQVVLAARGGGATLGWISGHRSLPRKTRLSVRRAAPRTLTIVQLDRRGRPAGPTTVVGRDVGATARLAGSPDGRLVASWLRPQKINPYPGEDTGAAPPPSAIVSPIAFTRQLLPRLQPARPLVSAGQVPAGVPTVAFSGPNAVTAWRVASQPGSGPLFDAVSAAAADGGPWPAAQLVAHLGFSRFDPVVVAPGLSPLVVTTALAPGAGTPVWTVAAGAQALGVTSTGDGRGVAVAHGGDRVLVAWPSTSGGVGVAEQG
jgi:hypothetical protein